MYGDIVGCVGLEEAVPERLRLLPSQARQVVYMLIRPVQLDGQQLHLQFQVLYLLSLGVIIPDWFVGDLGGLAGVLEGTQIFIDIFVTRVQTGYHATEGVTTQRLSKQTSELRVPVGNIHPA